MGANRSKQAVHTTTALIVLCGAEVSSAATIYGGPTFDPSTGNGYTTGRDSALVDSNVSGNRAMFASSATKFVANSNLGTRPFFLDSTSSAPVELGVLGTTSSGVGSGALRGINISKTAIGVSNKYVDGVDLGTRPVRWDPNSTIPVELGIFGTRSNTGISSGEATAINDTGLIVGYVNKYVAGQGVGLRAVRWNPGSTTAIELGNIGTSSIGNTTCRAVSVNSSGTTIGYCSKFIQNITKGDRPVRWDASSTVAVELQMLGVDNTGYALGYTDAINDAGICVGAVDKYDQNFAYFGGRAVRWDTAGAVTELGNLGTNLTGTTNTTAQDINASGIIVGTANRYNGNTNLGYRATRWDTTGNAIELGNIGLSPTGTTLSEAHDINDLGLSVGYANAYSLTGTLLGTHAILWGQDGVAVDLNSLIEPNSGWVTLTEARYITNTNWVSGYGMFDPDGAGSQAAYARAFTLQVPEPTMVGVYLFGTLVLLRRGRRA